MEKEQKEIVTPEQKELLSKYLNQFVSAVEARNQHIEDNKALFAAHEAIVGRVIDAENNLRDLVAMIKTLPQDKDCVLIQEFGYKITNVPQEQKVYDDEKLSELLEPAELEKVVKLVQRPGRVSIRPL